MNRNLLFRARDNRLVSSGSFSAASCRLGICNGRPTANWPRVRPTAFACYFSMRRFRRFKTISQIQLRAATLGQHCQQLTMLSFAELLWQFFRRLVHSALEQFRCSLGSRSARSCRQQTPQLWKILLSARSRMPLT